MCEQINYREATLHKITITDKDFKRALSFLGNFVTVNSEEIEIQIRKRNLNIL